MSVVGFDFGNANCTIAAAQNRGVDVLTNEVSSRQTPSMVSFGEKERYLGEGAMTQYLRNIKNTITDIKRIIGRKWSEKGVQEELVSLAFKAVELPNDEIGVEVMYAGELRTFSVVAVCGMLLHKLKEITEKALSRPCKDVVISVPSFWTDQQRTALLTASRVADLNCLRLLNETTATAIQYGIYKTNLSDTEPLRVMFIDCGQSSMTATIVEFLKGKMKVVATAFDRNLGGRNFDVLLAQHFAAEFRERYKLDVVPNSKAWLRLLPACEKLKKVLNTNAQGVLSIDSLLNDVDVKATLLKDDFMTLAQPLIDRHLNPVKEVLQYAGLQVSDLGAVEITGGGSRLIPVKQKFAEFLGKELSQTMNSEEAVAKGCALQCAILSPLFKVREYSITDVTTYPIKVSWKTTGADGPASADDTLELFSRFHPIPAPKMVTFHRSEGLEISADYADPSLLPEGAPSHIASFQIPKLPSKDHPVKIQVKIKMDLHNIVSMEQAQLVETVEEETEKKEEKAADKMEEDAPAEKKEEKEGEEKKEEKKEEPKKKKVKKTGLEFTSHSSAVNEQILQQLIEEEGKMSASDQLAAETADMKNQVESYVYDTRSKLEGSLGPYGTPEEKEKLRSQLEETEDWLYGEGEDQSKSVYAQRLSALLALGTPLSQRLQEYEGRYEHLSALRSTIESYRLSATSQDPKYDHIEAAEKEKVLQECKKVEDWANEQMAKQDALPKHVDPVIRCAELQKKKTDLERFCNPILNKPKPKPKPEEKKEEKPEEKKEEKKAEAKEETKPMEEETTTKPEAEMDLD